MKPRLSRYKDLMVKETAGIISPKDLASLNKAKAKYPEVYQLWLEHQKIFTEKEMEAWLNERSVLPSLSKLPPGKVRRKPPLLIITGLLATLAGGLYVLRPAKTVDLRPLTVELRLENGHRFDLSHDGEFHSDNIKVINRKGALTYSSAAAESAVLWIPPGKNYNILLSDGTKIELNAGSTLRFPTTFKNAPTREVHITGEAYLKIAPDANRPFIVKTLEGDVKVLGTAFNINSYEKGKLQVTLVEGKVLLKINKDTLVMQPGYTAINTNNGIQTEKTREEALSWRQGYLNLKNKTMEELIKDLSRIFGREVLLDNPAIAKDTLGGKLFSNESIESNLNRLKGPYGFEYFTDSNNIIHIK